MKKKNLILLSMAFSMACALCSGHAHARVSFRNGISLKHGEITAPFVKEGTANYDAENKVLTLENAVIESWLTITDDDVTINLIGENVIDNSNVTGGIIYYGALYMYDANLTITSVQEGSLKIIDKDKGSSLFDSKLTIKDCSVAFDGAMMGLIGHRYDLAVDNGALYVHTDNGVGIAGIQSLELTGSEVVTPNNYEVNSTDGCLYYTNENKETEIYRGDLKVVKTVQEQKILQQPTTQKPGWVTFRNGINLKNGEVTAPFIKQGTVTYDAANKVLTLDNAVIESWLTITDADLTINLIGENVIDKTNVTGGITYYGALYLYAADVTITSEEGGSLKVVDPEKGASIFDSKLTVKDCSVAFDGAMMGLIGHRYDLAVDNAELTVHTDNGVGIAGIQSLELKDSEVQIPDNYKVNVADGCIYYVSENEEDIYRGDLKVVKADQEQQVRQHTLTGISDVNTSQDKKQPVYNLQGVQVNPSRKGGAPGIRIVGGKKYFVR